MASCEPAVKEDEHHMTLTEKKHEGKDLASSEPPPPTLKEKDPTEASKVKEADEDGEDLLEGGTENPSEDKAKEQDQALPTDGQSYLQAEEKVEIISASESEPTMNESRPDQVVSIEGQDGGIDLKQEAMRSNPDAGTQLKSTSDVVAGSKTYFETSSKSKEEGLPESYYEVSTTPDTTLRGETETVQTPEEQEKILKTSPGKKSLEQRSLSLSITVGSSGGQTVTGNKPRTFSESLLPISGSFDESAVSSSNSSEHRQTPKITPPVSITPAPSAAPEDVPEAPADQDACSLKQSGSLSEMLDLAGALPRPKELDHMRRKSVPANVSALVGSSLAKLSLTDQTSAVVPGERQLEELGYCVFSEYSAPMPSPADVPSPGDSPHQCFPSVEPEVDEEVECAPRQIQVKDIAPEIVQRTMLDKKDSPVKTPLILEKAVPSGIKPDRLRIPTSKDRLTELRLETGLPGDIKIQPIPEVDVEKDPSREASPIPPDNSFFFTATETGNKTPLTPTTPKSPNDERLETQVTGENTRKDALPEKTEDNLNNLDNNGDQPDMTKTAKPLPSSRPLHECTEEKDNEMQSTQEKLAKLEGIENPKSSTAAADLDEKDTHIQLQKATPAQGSPKPQMTSPIIIIPQAQVDEEAEEDDDIEIAEEPQEMMEEAEPLGHKTDQDESLQKKCQEKEQVRLMVDDQLLEDDPKSGAEEWSHSGQNSDEPATDSSHLSPCSDHDLPKQTEEGGGDEDMEADKKDEHQQMDRLEGDKERERTREEEVEQTTPEINLEKKEETTENEEMKKEKETETGQEASSQAPNDETGMEVSILDTDSAWMDSQGTKALYIILLYNC